MTEDIEELVKSIRADWYGQNASLMSRAADALLAQAADLAEARSEIEHLTKRRDYYRTRMELADAFRDEALAALKASEERGAAKDAVLCKFLDFADADYVPNTLFDRARSAMENGSAALADATNNPPSDPGTEQREAGR